MIHAVVAMLFVAAMLGHIYIGTIGMEGDFEATARARCTSLVNTTGRGWKMRWPVAKVRQSYPPNNHVETFTATRPASRPGVL